MVKPKPNIYGLIGKEIRHSFSPNYFQSKFLKEQILDCEYKLFHLEKISDFNLLIKQNNLKGLNVTIPYKEGIIPFLDELDDTAKKINAVNTIQFKSNKLIGFNTDVIGFEKSLKPLLKNNHKKALIFGTGGASKAVSFVLEKLKISFEIISQTKSLIKYSDINAYLLNEYHLLINTTPLGMLPIVKTCVDIEYSAISDKHLVYDLVYNPLETEFLKKAKQQGAIIKNGLEMLEIQAEESWKIWNK